MLKTENPQNDFIIRKLIKEQHAYLVLAKQKLEQANQETSAERERRALAERRAQDDREQRALAEQQIADLQARLTALGVVDPNVGSNALDSTAEMDSASKFPKHHHP